MADPFDSSKRTLARAKEHIRNLEEQFRLFHDEHPYRRVFHPDHERNLVVIAIALTKKIPETFDNIAFDAVSNLRAALDQAVYAVALASGHSISHAAFPFGGTIEDSERALSRKAKYLPQEILALLRTFQAYKGGNDLLCTLNDICNRNKHAILTAVGMTGVRTRGSFNSSAGGFMSVPENPVWDSVKNEIVIATVGPDTHFDYDVDFGFAITFAEVQAVKGEEAIALLNKMAGIVEGVVLAIEAEFRRLGFVK